MSRCMLATLILMLAANAALAINEMTTIVLHGVEEFGSCSEYGGMDCSNIYATVDIAGFSTPAIYIFLRNHEDVTGLQCAFRWPESWEFSFGLFSCQANQVNGTAPTASGELTGTIATAFDVITGGELEVIGILRYDAAPEGCLQIIDSAYPFGTHVVSQATEVTEIPDGQRGSICVGSGGCDACVSCIGPVEETSWGRIKRLH